MLEYHKIQTCFKRDVHGKIILNEWVNPEIEYLRNNEWIFTEKVDGTNIRIIWDGQRITYGGKTDNAQIPAFLFRRLQDLFDGKEDMFSDHFATSIPLTTICLYGEGYGAKIQKGGGNYKPDGVDFVLFDVKINDWWLKREDVEEIAAFFNIDIVPIIGTGTIRDAIDLTMTGQQSRWGDFLSEGIVARPVVDLKSRSGERIITKIKHKDFKHLGTAS